MEQKKAEPEKTIRILDDEKHNSNTSFRFDGAKIWWIMVSMG